MKTVFLIATLLFGASTLASGGKLKEVNLMHMEALAMHLYGNKNTDQLELRQTAIVAAPKGYALAVQSDVYVYSPKLKRERWVYCTSYFKKSVNLEVTKVSCRQKK